jgi:predicted O-methyltransferase YrrM
MKKYILDLIKKNKNEFEQISPELENMFHVMSNKWMKKEYRQNHQHDGTTSSFDCKFLSLLVLEYKPKLILEIGTFIGTTAYSMAITAKSLPNLTSLHTVDVYDRFVKLDNEVVKNITRHSGKYSYDFLPNCNLSNVDMFFIDANLSKNDYDDLYRLASPNFILAAHDYFANPQGNTEKGYETLELMKKVLNKNNASYTEYIPNLSWYNGSEDTMNINGCCGLLVCNKK